MLEVDVLVIGGGMAGLSAAAHLAAHGRVVVLEQEAQCAYHSTGRSAAVYLANYGNAAVRQLNRASLGFLQNPGMPHWRHALLSPRGAMFFATRGLEDKLQPYIDEPDNVGIEWADAAKIQRINPHINLDVVTRATYESHPQDIDVNELQMGYTRWLKAEGGVVHTGQRVSALMREGDAWRVHTQGGAQYRATKVVNAAGAWADAVAELAGLAPLGIQAFRRSAALVPLPAGIDSRAWPLMVHVEESFYCKPDAGKLLISPADETPVDAHDAYADDFTIAETVEAAMQYLNLEIDRVDHTWAGLRCFAPDRCHVIGEDPRAQGFYWLAGQGGYGIQSAPAAAQLLAAQLLGQALNPALKAESIDARQFAPQRLL